MRRRSDNSVYLADDVACGTSVHYVKATNSMLGDDILYFMAEHGDILKPLPCKALAMEVEEVDTGVRPWTEVCFIQFAGVTDDEARKASSAAQTRTKNGYGSLCMQIAGRVVEDVGWGSRRGRMRLWREVWLRLIMIGLRTV